MLGWVGPSGRLHIKTVHPQNGHPSPCWSGLALSNSVHVCHYHDAKLPTTAYRGENMISRQLLCLIRGSNVTFNQHSANPQRPYLRLYCEIPRGSSWTKRSVSFQTWLTVDKGLNRRIRLQRRKLCFNNCHTHGLVITEVNIKYMITYEINYKAW